MSQTMLILRLIYDNIKNYICHNNCLNINREKNQLIITKKNIVYLNKTGTCLLFNGHNTPSPIAAN